MNFCLIGLHQILKNSTPRKFNTVFLLYVLQFHTQNSSFSALLLIDLNKLTNRDAFLCKGMIGGNADNGKGDTYF